MRRVAPVVGVLLLLVFGGLARPAAAKDDAAVWAKDLEFLLEELPKRAKTLLGSKKIDWANATKDLRAPAKKVKDDVEYVKLVERILARLQDGHAGITKLAPDVEAKWKAFREEEAKGRKWTGPRVHLLAVGKKVYVGEAFGEAATLGVKVGMEVVTVDDVPARTWLEKKAAEMRDTQGFSTEHAALYAAGHWGLATWAGTPVSFVFQARGDRKPLTITRNGGPNFAPAGPLIPPKDLQSVGRQSYGKTKGGFGYVHLRDVPDDLPGQLDTILAALGDVPGLVLDMRANGGGGCDHEGVFGRFVPKGTKWRQYPSQGAAPYVGPMVVIVDGGVR
jgi:carboxyl-terminal processing protease